MEKINKTKNWLFEKIKWINLQLNSPRKKTEDTKPNERGAITADATKVQRLKRDGCEQLHANKLTNVTPRRQIPRHIQPINAELKRI